jgi:hypothetical protein
LPAAAGLLLELLVELPPVVVLLELELLEQAAKAIGMTAATVMPTTRADFRYDIRSS